MPSSLRESILGTWILRSWVRTLDAVEEPGPFGSDALGQLVYSPDGHMSGHDAGGLVLHRVELSSNPNWTGTVQRRLVEFIGARMKLTTPPLVRHGKAAASVLVWERAPAP